METLSYCFVGVLEQDILLCHFSLACVVPLYFLHWMVWSISNLLSSG